MSKKKPNKYWLGKIKLWMVLHVDSKVSEYKLCNLCHNCIKEGMNRWIGYGCQRKNNYEGRLMYRRDFSDIEFDPIFINGLNYDSDWICAEWVKDV